MVQSFRIDAVLNLKSNAVPELAQLGSKFEAFDKIVKATTTNVKAFETALGALGTGRKLSGLITSLERLGRVHMGNLSGLAGLAHLSHLGNFNTAGINKVAASMAKLSGANLGNLSGHLQATLGPLHLILNVHQQIGAAAHNISTAWATAAGHISAAAAGMRGMRSPPGPPGMGGGGGSGGAHGSGGINRWNNHFEGSRAVEDAANSGGMISGAIKQGLKAEFEPSFSMSEEMAKLQMGGFTAAEAMTAHDKAFETQRNVMGATILGNIDIIKDLNAVFHNAAESIKMMPEMAAMGVVLGKVGKKDAINELFQAAQGGELRGLNQPGSDELDTGKFAAFLHKLEMVAVGTGGRIGPAEYLGFLRSARGAGTRLSDEALFTSIPAAMMALKSVRAGTALQSWSQSEFGHLAAGYASEQEKFGLIRKGAYTKTKGGSTIMKPGGVINEDLMQGDPVHYILDWLVPQLKKGLDPLGKMNPKDLQNAIIKELIKLYPRSTITGAVEEIAVNPAMMQRAIDAFQTGGKLDSADNNKILQGADAKLHLDAMTASWTAFMTALGESSTGNAVKILDGLTGSLNSLSIWASRPENAGTAKTLTEVAVGLGVVTTAMMALGLALMVITPMAAAITAAIGGGAVVGALFAHAFPGKHKPGEVSLADQLLDHLGIRPKASGKTSGPTYDDYGREVPNFGGPGAAPPAAANNNTPGSSAANPIYNMQLNQPSTRDTALGNADFMGRQIHGPSTGGTHYDQTMGPSFSIFGRL